MSEERNTLVAKLTLNNGRLQREHSRLRRQLVACRREVQTARQLWTMCQELQHRTHLELVAALAQRDEFQRQLEAAREELCQQIGPCALSNEPR